MNHLLAGLIYFGCIFIEVSLGGFFVSQAIDRFKREQYWLFGVNVMLVIYCAVHLVRAMFIEF